MYWTVFTTATVNQYYNTVWFIDHQIDFGFKIRIRILMSMEHIESNVSIGTYIRRRESDNARVCAMINF